MAESRANAEHHNTQRKPPSSKREAVTLKDQVPAKNGESEYVLLPSFEKVQNAILEHLGVCEKHTRDRGASRQSEQNDTAVPTRGDTRTGIFRFVLGQYPDAEEALIDEALDDLVHEDRVYWDDTRSYDCGETVYRLHVRRTEAGCIEPPDNYGQSNIQAERGSMDAAIEQRLAAVRDNAEPPAKTKSTSPPEPGCRKRFEVAYQYCKLAEEKMSPPPHTDKEAYDWLKKNGATGEDDRLPSFETWQRYVTAARQYHNDRKNTPRAGRTAGPSVVRPRDV